MELSEKLELYGNMVLSCHKLYLWTYDMAMRPISTNCPDAALVNALFSLEDKRELMQYYAERHTKPIVTSNRYGMMWIAIPAHEDNRLSRIYVLGPFFIDAVSTDTIQAAISGLDVSAEVKFEVSDFLRSLPVVGLNRAFEYAIMLYYCINGENISVSDMHYLESERLPERTSAEQRESTHGTYELEREMVRMVREGNLNYKSQLSRLAVTGNLGKLAPGGTDRQMKNAVLVCTILFSRAAIEGGVSPEVALTLTDNYFQSIEASRNISELSDTAFTMQEDFVRRVHKARMSKLSPPIREACDYIDLHIEDEITLKALAEKLRYSESYLSRKFKEETNKGIIEYIRLKKLERAKDMLRDNSLTIKEISERLGFCSLSYFGKSFKEAYGISPSEWRDASDTDRT